MKVYIEREKRREGRVRCLGKKEVRIRRCRFKVERERTKKSFEIKRDIGKRTQNLGSAVV